MKTIGLIGGLSWESSAEYYRVVNETVREQLGGLHSADCLMYSFDFAEIESLQKDGRWDEAAQRMVTAAQRLERGGAECLIICSNTMHKMADAVQAAISVPLLHIADPTAEALKAQGLQTVGLLATAYTMEQPFYKSRLADKYRLTVLVPDAEQRQQVHRIIYEELCLGIIRETSRQFYQQVIEALAKRGAEAVILGCTEIGLLIKPEHSLLPTFDTTLIHARAAVDFALSEVMPASV